MTGAKADLSSRIDRYTAASVPAQAVSTSNLPPPAPPNYQPQAPPSPLASMRTIPSTANFWPEPPAIHHGQYQHLYPLSLARDSTRISGSQSNTDVRTYDGHHSQRTDNQPIRSSSLIMPSPTLSEQYWSDSVGHSHINGAEPRIFPGVVHERTRKGSIRQNSSSEHDSDAAGSIGVGMSRLITSEKEEKSYDKAVLEDSEED